MLYSGTTSMPASPSAATSDRPATVKRRLLRQARAAIAADWSCVAIPGDAEGSIESWALLASLGVFILQLWEPGPDVPRGMLKPRMSLTVGAGRAGFGGIMLHFDSYETIDAALKAAADKLREIAASALGPLRI